MTNVLLEVNNLHVKRDGRLVLDVEHLRVEEGQVLAVIGPNGAGKSTLLLALSRLLPPDGGQIIFRNRPLEDEKGLVYRRRIALVLQEPLLTDASVFDNVAMGLRFRGFPRRQILARVEEWLTRLGVRHLSNRPARSLSGGEAQRVSLARAFALEPELLFLDEPFSALDAPTRARLLEDFHTLLSNLSLTTVFITHDLDEALYLGDQVAVLLEGQVRQYGPPELVFSAPADRQVAEFVGVETVIAGQVVARDEGQITVESAGLRLDAIGEVALGRQVLLCLRPEDVTLWPVIGAQASRIPSASSARNRLNGQITRLVPQGPLARVIVDCGFPLVALVTRASVQELGLDIGDEITAAFKASAVHLIPR